MNPFDQNWLRHAPDEDLVAAYRKARRHRNVESALALAGAVLVGLSGWSLWLVLIPGVLAVAAYGHHAQLGLIVSEESRRAEAASLECTGRPGLRRRRPH